ncbi:MAG: MFS transporter [Ilumatobacteraceae bacterium]|nr:MFS transporter [Ilumatobacteraceae bacterium]
MSDVGELLRIRSVRRFLFSVGVSFLGVYVMVTALFKQAFDITGGTLAIGLLGLAQFLPALLFALVSGVVADRFDRRRVVALASLAHLLSIGAMAWYATTDPTEVWPLYVFAFTYGTSDAFLAPSIRSMPPLVAPLGRLPQLVAVWTGVFTAATIVGPATSGLLYSIDPVVPYAVAWVLVAASILPLLGVRYANEPAHDRERPTLAAAFEGLRFVRRTPIVLAAISLDLFAVLFGGAVALIPSVAADRLEVGDVAYGWLRAAPGIGAAIMAVWLAVRPVTRRIGPTLLVVVAVFGLGTIAFGLTTSYVVAFAALIVLSAADMVSMFIRGALVPTATPDDQLGRVVAVESVFIGASNELGAFESGMAATAFGVPAAIVGGGVITVGVAAAWAVLFPSLRRIDTFDEIDVRRQSTRTATAAVK